MATGMGTDGETTLHIYYPHSILHNDPYITNALYLTPMAPLPAITPMATLPAASNATIYSEVGVQTERDTRVDALMAEFGAAMRNMKAALFPGALSSADTRLVGSSTSRSEAAAEGPVGVGAGFGPISRPSTPVQAPRAMLAGLESDQGSFETPGSSPEKTVWGSPEVASSMTSPTNQKGKACFVRFDSAAALDKAALYLREEAELLAAADGVPQAQGILRKRAFNRRDADNVGDDDIGEEPRRSIKKQKIAHPRKE